MKGSFFNLYRVFIIINFVLIVIKKINKLKIFIKVIDIIKIRYEMIKRLELFFF